MHRCRECGGVLVVAPTLLPNSFTFLDQHALHVGRCNVVGISQLQRERLNIEFGVSILLSIFSFSGPVWPKAGDVSFYIFLGRAKNVQSLQKLGERSRGIRVL